MLIDETPTYREGLQNILRTLGYRNLVSLSDAHSALSIMRSEQVGFIICERNLKSVSGIEFLREVRESPDFPRVPFMMMSGDIAKEDVLLAAEFGIDSFLKKPFVLKDVSSRISQCIQRFQDATSTEFIFEEARELFAQANYKKALELYAKIMTLSPSSARARVAMARCYRAIQDFEQAETKLKDAINLNSMYVHAFHELGLVYLQKKQNDEALKNFNAAIELSPNNPIRYETVADILMKMQKWEEAEEYLMKAVKLELVYPVLYSNLGKVLFAQKKTDKAAKFFEKALVKEPDNTSYLNSLGICYKDLGKFREAIDSYNLALKYRPSDTKILFNKALCLMQMTDYERATKVLNLILKADPGYDKAKSKLSEIQRIQGENKSAS